MYLVTETTSRTDLRSSYICNLIMQGKDIYDVDKLAGHSITFCERYYAKLDMSRKSKELTDTKQESKEEEGLL